MTVIRLISTTVCVMLLASPVLAADRYHFDKNHTNIVWAASHLGFSKSFGTFLEFEGGFTLDEKEPENSSVSITIQTDSISTGIPKFDAHLKSDDFFDVKKFPIATFKSTEIKKTGEKTAEIHGDFTMLGQTHPLTLDATLNKVGTNSFNKKQTAGFSIRGTIDRTKYGMSYGVPGIPAEVELMVEAEGIKQTENPGAAD